MDDDVIIVDDPATLPATHHDVASPPTRSSMMRPPESSDRATRSSTVKPKLQPKLKLKLSEKAAAQAPGMSFLGSYDRELDSDEEDIAFEEQFILRMPPGEDCDKLRKMVAAREITNDVWFKFKGGFFCLSTPRNLNCAFSSQYKILAGPYFISVIQPTRPSL
jgi:transcription initiation factor TFIID subunit 7